MRHGNRWARLLAAMCAMALVLSVISPALAAKYPYDTVSMDDVNMRSRANTTSTILKKIQKGDTVTILGVTGSFYRVEFGRQDRLCHEEVHRRHRSFARSLAQPGAQHAGPAGHLRISYDTTVIDFVKLRKVGRDGGRGHPDHSRRQRGHGV